MTRTKNYLVQVKLSFIFKALALAASFILIPILIQYLGQEKYGIWSILLSFISWLVFFDLGIGNGLRNKLAEYIAVYDTVGAQKVITSAYILIGGITIIIFTVFIFFNQYISWNKVFNSNVMTNNEFGNLIIVLFSFILLNFWLSLINQILNGTQKSSLVVFNQLLSNFISLVTIFVLKDFSHGNLFYIAFIYGLSLVVSSILISIWYFSGNKNLIPKISQFEYKYIKSIISLGFSFFIIQIAVVVVFTTDKILIAQLFNPEEVTKYDVVLKLFSIVLIGYSIITTPLWSAYTNAYKNSDFIWLKENLIKQIKLFIIIVLFVFILIIISPSILTFWISETFNVDYEIIFFMGIFTIVNVWNSIFATFLNALSITKLQMYTSIYAMLVNIPLSIFIVKYFEIGVHGIIIGTIVSLLLFAILGPFEVYKVLKYKGIINEN
ncbi:polysaccharide biosynthesis protein [Aliarcobacter skirrowii]|uniref:oligosaccharide flippase family protein n=1 Tax=Aliarcobacter skirrowii TaxID=28200 RepID=UPI000F68588F|nr:oligosaccharide flippase family protein [Aliarcobacter skirrowii]AZL54037.1 polysaccharide biosynthesis protein [Aliarcobacter skirrowii]